MSETTIPQVGEQNAQPQAEIEIKYNHEVKKISLDEAKTLAQKGLNYDKVVEKLTTFENDEAIKWLNAKASEYGVSPKDLVKKWDEDLTAKKVGELAEAQGIPEDIAKELLEAKKEATLTKKERDDLKEKLQQQERIDHQIEQFKTAYPDVDLNKIPDEVLILSRDEGIPLKVAYKAYLADVLAKEKTELEQQLNIKQVNDANAESSMGSVASSGDTQNAELTMKTIEENKNNKTWLRANMTRIMEGIANKSIK